ncbi:TPR-like protein [Serendipita vermifera]|nr:TPR-like protein [Serendipita vermifera]
MYNIQCHGHSEEKYERPCEIFDMIAGSGTAGLIAIFLVIFGMTVEEASDTFAKISQEVFNNSNSSSSTRSSILKEMIEVLLASHQIPLNATLLDQIERSRGCKLLVPIATRASVSLSTRLRNYKVREEPPIPITIIEACMATVSKPSFFEPVFFRHRGVQYEYISGDPNFPNPVCDCISEMFGLSKEAGVACLVNIGSGESDVIRVPTNFDSPEWKFYQERVIRDGERTAKEMALQLGHLGIYYRFHAIEGPAFDPKKGDVIEQIRSNTRNYLREGQDEIYTMLRRCVESLQLRIIISTAERLHRSGGGQFTAPGLPPLSNHFVMRVEPWDRIVNYIMGSNGVRPQTQRILVVSGLGGCGKTQLVIKFAKEFGSQFKSVLFTDGSSENAYRTDLVRHIRSLGSEHSQKTFDEALDYLSQNNTDGEHLLILDNVDDPDINVEPLLPQCDHGVIIITTRNSTLRHLTMDGHLTLDSLSEEEAMEALVSASRRLFPTEESDIVHMKRVCAELGYLAIALVQAGSYMAQTGIDPNTYIERLQRNRRTIMKHPAAGQRDMRRYKSAYAAFEASYEALPQREQKTLQLLGMFHWSQFPAAHIERAAKGDFESQRFGYLDREPQFQESINLLKDIFLYADTWDPYLWDSTVITLQKYSFITITSTSTTALMNMHPLTHMWLNDRFSSTTEQENFTAASIRLLGIVDEEWHAENQYLTVQMLHSLTRISDMHVNDRASFAKLLDLGGEHQHAAKIWEAVVEELKRIRGDRHMDTFGALTHLCMSYSMLGRHREEEALLKGALKGYQEAYGRKHPYTAAVSGHLAAAYASIGQHQEAKQLHEEVLELRKELLGDKHPDTITASAQLAATYYNLGQLMEAEELQLEVLMLSREILGDRHPDTMASSGQLAATYFTVGKFKQAEELYEEMLGIRRDIFGDKHPKTMNAYYSLASAQYQLGNHHIALRTARHAKLLMETHLNYKHAHYDFCCTLISDIEHNLALADSSPS